MEEKCVVLWTAKCTTASIRFGERKSNEYNYNVQYHFALRYYPKEKVSLRLGEDMFEITAEDSYFCIPPDTKYRATYLAGSTRQGYFDIIFLVNDPIMQERLKQKPLSHQVGEAERVMLNYIIENWHRQDAEVQSTCNSFLTALLLLLFAGETKPESLGSQFILTGGYSKATLCALDYIERNYLSRFTLDELAETTGYSKNYLCMTFSRDTGTTIVTYTNFLRLRKAIGIFLYFPSPINIISESLSFESPNYFGRTFKAFIGLSPREFNKAARRMTPEEKAELYANEPLLDYQRHSFEVMLRSMRHIGDILKSFSAP